MRYLSLPRPSATLMRSFLNLVFPETCWASGVPLAEGQRALSEAARRQIASMLLWPYCGNCGITTGHGAQHDALNPCPQCASRDLGVSRVVRVGTFNDPLDTLVKTLKFQRRWELARLLAPFLMQAMNLATQDGRAVPIDVLVPVALHWRRRLSRGFNQSLELAAEVSKISGWPVADVLWRRRPTAAQSQTQSAAQRKSNLRTAFICPMQNLQAQNPIAGKHVWLIDDVSTTGATLHAAAMALKRLPKPQRPAAVYAAVICITDALGAQVFSTPAGL